MENLMRAADKAPDVTVLERLTHMNEFHDFELRLRDHLKSKIGSAGTSLLYVIRSNEDGFVGDEHRNGTVGHGPTDVYSDWIDYTIRCTVHSGDHFLSDNARVWAILYSLVASGPGWNYIKNHGNKDGTKGNVRTAFFELRQQAYNTTIRDFFRSMEDFYVMTEKLSHILGLNESINIATNNRRINNCRVLSTHTHTGKRKRQNQRGGSGDGNNNGGGGNASDKQPLWKTNPYREKIEGKFYPQKVYLRFSPEQRILHYELGGSKGTAGPKNRSVPAATSPNSDTDGAGEGFGRNARKKTK